MKLHTVSPTKSYLVEYTQEELSDLRKALTYTNTSIQHLIKRHSKNHFWKSRNEESWQLKQDELKKDLKKCLVFEEEGKFYIRPGSIPYLTGFTVEVENSIVYPKLKKIPWFKPLPFELHPYQEESWPKLIEEKLGNVSLTTGCHSKGTNVIMFDGTNKKIEEIVIGDLLIGPDSTPRRVTKLFNGIDEMYRIVPTKGEEFVVNGHHILSLQRTNLGNRYLKKDGTRSSQKFGPNPITNISVVDYLKTSKTFKHVNKLYRTGVEFSNQQDLKIPPYILGLWLGDGASSRPSLTTMDVEIETAWCDYLKSLGLKISILQKDKGKAKDYAGILFGKYIPSKKSQNAGNINLEYYGLINNKHIPIEYLTASRNDRLELLAGLIDTDGHLAGGYYEIIQKNNKLSKEILYLARSLGFGAVSKKKESYSQTGVVGIYNRISITGNISKIPCRLQRKIANARLQIKNVLRTGFQVKSLGLGEYFGFELDGDHLYLLEDFTVTHNSGKSAIVLKLCREMGLNTCIVVPSKSIFEELLDKFEYHFGKGKVGALGAGKRRLDKKFTIAIADSLVNLKEGTEEYKFFSELEVFIADESHTLPSETLEQVCHGVLSRIPYRFFLSGTQTRNDGSIPLLQSIIGKTVSTLTTEEAIKGGFICPHEFRIVSVETSNPSFESSEPLEMKREHFLKNKNIAQFSARLANAMGAQKQGTLILVEELSQIAMLTPLLNVPYVVAHSEKRKERLVELGLEKVDNFESVEKFNKGEVLVLIGTSCIATGTNIFPCHSVVNWMGGSSPIKTKQGAVGRAVRFGHSNPWASKCLPKNNAIIYDFDIEDNWVMSRHLESRIDCYKESGTAIKYVRLK